MKILLAVASKHGSTEQVAEVIAKVLGERGHEVTLSDPAQVESLDGYEAVVLGSAVYMTAWMDSAREFAKRFAHQITELPLWAFSVGLSGVPRGNAQDPARVGPMLLQIQPIDYRTFSGKLDPSDLNLRERTIARLGGALEGDYRDFEEVSAWANSIADHLAK